MTDEAKYLVIRNRRGGKSTWHLATCPTGQSAARKREADGWGFTVDRPASGKNYHHRINQTCGKCHPESSIQRDQFPTLYGAQ
jgi:hypothetical protein